MEASTRLWNMCSLASGLHYSCIRPGKLNRIESLIHDSPDDSFIQRYLTRVILSKYLSLSSIKL